MGVTRFPGATTRQQDFTTSGTWLCPSGVYSAEFLVVGGGGGGGGISLTTAVNYAAGAGGGGGAVKKVNLAVTPGTSYTITIGAKGSGGSATIGGTGSASEVLNGATSLIKCWGGQGGGGVTADTEIRPTVSRTIAGAGGAARAGNTTSTAFGGGGGGASATNSAASAYTGGSSPNNIYYGGEGSNSQETSSTATNTYVSFGGMGVDGYGAGGSGGMTLAAAQTRNLAGYSVFAGAGGFLLATGSANGGAATENTGCGGGGSANFTNSTTTVGGNGADGLVRVVYFA